MHTEITLNVINFVGAGDGGVGTVDKGISNNSSTSTDDTPEAPTDGSATDMKGPKTTSQRKTRSVLPESSTQKKSEEGRDKTTSDGDISSKDNSDNTEVEIKEPVKRGGRGRGRGRPARKMAKK